MASKNRHTRRAQKKRRALRAKVSDDARRLAYSKSVAGDKGVKSCGQKRRYPSRYVAMMHMGDVGDGSVLRTYHCDICGGWHLTSSRVSPKQRIDKLMDAEAERSQ